MVILLYPIIISHHHTLVFAKHKAVCIIIIRTVQHPKPHKAKNAMHRIVQKNCPMQGIKIRKQGFTSFTNVTSFKYSIFSLHMSGALKNCPVFFTLFLSFIITSVSDTLCTGECTSQICIS